MLVLPDVDGVLLPVEASGFADWAAVSSAMAAAIAAIAAWAAVVQAGRWQRRQREPWLNIQVSEILGAGQIRVRIATTRMPPESTT